MKIIKRHLKQIIREAVSSQWVEPNRVVKSLPSTYQPIQWKSMMGQRKWARKFPEKYLSPEQQEKYGDKIAKMRQTDPHQADTLIGTIVDEPTGWYDSSKSFTEEEEILFRMHSEDQIPDINDPVKYLDRRRQSVPPTVEKLVAESNPDYKIVRKAAYKIYSASGVANPWGSDSGTNAASRLYDLINELALKDILTAKAKIKEYLTDAKYAADREEIVSNYRHTGKNGKKLLADMETLVSSFEKQYKTAMNWYYTGQIADGWYMPMLESKQSYRGNKMKISKRQLKQIIREEYSSLKRLGLLKESNSAENATSDLVGVQQQYGAEMELDYDSAVRNKDFIMKAQELTPAIAGFEYLGSCEDNEGYSAWVFWDGRNYQIASGSGASWDLYTCKDAVEAYLCIEMCSYNEPMLHPDALAYAGLESQDQAYDWHESLITKQFNLRTF